MVIITGDPVVVGIKTDRGIAEGCDRYIPDCGPPVVRLRGCTAIDTVALNVSWGTAANFLVSVRRCPSQSTGPAASFAYCYRIRGCRGDGISTGGGINDTEAERNPGNRILSRPPERVLSSSTDCLTV